MRNYASEKSPKVSQQEIANPKNCNGLLRNPDPSLDTRETPRDSVDCNDPPVPVLPDGKPTADRASEQTIQRNAARKKMLIEGTKRLTYTATLTALALVLKLVSQLWGGYLQLFSLKLSFIYTAWILAAVILGPLEGMAVGFISDVLGTFIFPSTGGVLPLLALSNSLFPLFVGLAVKFFPHKNVFLKIVIGTAFSMIVCTLGLSTWGLSLAYGTPFLSQLALRWAQPIVISLNVVIVGALLPILKRMRLISVKC